MSDEPKLTFPDGEVMKFAEPHLVESTPVCRIELWSDGQRYFKTAHEPVEGQDVLLDSADDPEIVVRVHVCGHCGCLYREKS